MDINKQRQEIAKFCGYKWYQERMYKEDEFGDYRYYNENWYVTIRPNETIYKSEILNIPYYLDDLNSMHDAEKLLSPTQCYAYNSHLGDIFGYWNPANKSANWIFHATAAQRAEAFLKTIGKWEE